MATRSIIAYEHPDTGNIYAAHCHYDGYIDYTGMVLHSLYNQPGKVKQLILRGSMRNIYTTNIPGVEIPDRPHTGVPMYYAHTEEDYKNNCPAYLTDVYALFEYADNAGAEYVYLYKDNEWLVSKYNDKDPSFRLLEQALQDVLGTEFATCCQTFHNAAPYWLQMESPLWD